MPLKPFPRSPLNICTGPPAPSPSLRNSTGVIIGQGEGHSSDKLLEESSVTSPRLKRKGKGVRYSVRRGRELSFLTKSNDPILIIIAPLRITSSGSRSKNKR